MKVRDLLKVASGTLSVVFRNADGELEYYESDEYEDGKMPKFILDSKVYRVEFNNDNADVYLEQE